MQKPFTPFPSVYSYIAFCLALMVLGFGLGRAVKHYDFQPKVVAVQSVDPISEKPSAEWTVKEPTQAVEFISGPLVADAGQLCVFRLNDPDTRADWVIVPEATCYVDSSGSSLAFASNVPSKYTIIAAVVEEGVPKILTHICEYGVNPQPEPGPSPNPDPTPKPNPSPITTLKDWVAQNVPEAGKNKAAALACCYESAASCIESGAIRSQEAAFSVIRTASQTKIDVETWGNFLDALSIKITENLDGSNDIKTLGIIFTEIAEGLKSVAVSETGSVAEQEVSASDIIPFTSPTCPDSTCKPTVQPLRRAK